MVAYRSAILKATLCYQPEVSTTSGLKVMAHYVIFTKVMTLTLNFIRFQQKKIWKVLDPDYISCKKIRTIGPVVWPVHREPTDKHANRQTDRQTVVTNILCKNLRFCKVTNRGDQYTLQKSTILQSNESRSESGTTFRNCKFKREDDDVMSNHFFQTASLTLTTTYQGQRSRTQSI